MGDGKSAEAGRGEAAEPERGDQYWTTHLAEAGRTQVLLQMAERTPEERQQLARLSKNRDFMGGIQAAFGKAPRRRPQHIYFVQSEVGGPIKIGAASDIDRRINTLQTASPYRLILVGIIAYAAFSERELHKRFAHLRLHGEWFMNDDELLEFIAALPDPRVAPDSAEG